MNINIWVLMSESVTALLRTRLEWDEEQRGEYRGPIGRVEHGIFSTMTHFSNVERMFKKPTVTGRKRHLFSLNFTSEIKAQEALDYLTANRASHFIIGGAWWWDSRQLGTQFIIEDVTRNVEIDDPAVDPPMVDDPDRLDGAPILQIVDPDFNWPQIIIQVTNSDITGISGTPTHSLHASLIDFMPDIVEYDDITGAIISTTPATVLTNVNRTQGQEPRRFT